MTFEEWFMKEVKFDPSFSGARDFNDIRENFPGLELTEKVWNFKQKEIDRLKAELGSTLTVNDQHRVINGNLRQGLSDL